MKKYSFLLVLVTSLLVGSAHGMQMTHEKFDRYFKEAHRLGSGKVAVKARCLAHCINYAYRNNPNDAQKRYLLDLLSEASSQKGTNAQNTKELRAQEIDRLIECIDKLVEFGGDLSFDEVFEDREDNTADNPGCVEGSSSEIPAAPTRTSTTQNADTSNSVIPVQEAIRILGTAQPNRSLYNLSISDSPSQIRTHRRLIIDENESDSDKEESCSSDNPIRTEESLSGAELPNNSTTIEDMENDDKAKPNDTTQVEEKNDESATLSPEELGITPISDNQRASEGSSPNESILVTEYRTEDSTGKSVRRVRTLVKRNHLKNQNTRARLGEYPDSTTQAARNQGKTPKNTNHGILRAMTYFAEAVTDVPPYLQGTRAQTRTQLIQRGLSNLVKATAPMGTVLKTAAKTTLKAACIAAFGYFVGSTLGYF